MGQANALHTDESDSSPHGAPLHAGSAGIVRLRVREPYPQVFVHDPHWPHVLTTQSERQQWLLQFPVSVKLGHAVPPFSCGVTTNRVRER